MFKKNKKESEFDTVEMINNLISSAITKRASDIHFEPFEEIFRVRFRIDGVLVPQENLPNWKKDEIISRIKVMAKLDITSKKTAQDGKINFKIDEQLFEIRVAILPVKHGEKIVLRILQSNKSEIKLDKIGFNKDSLQLFKSTISSQQGLVLITGSTGSGKTTTIYSALNHLNSDEINIVTVEDPIEYEVQGINQVQISRELRMNYSDVLKAVLRQDPDILVIGEIRDPETARVAIQAALTGHLVIASIHTNDAIDTIVRLSEMGIESYLIAASLKLIVNQRLIRILCNDCKIEKTIESNDANLLKIENERKVFYPVGCENCNNTGYFGRRPIFEILEITDEVNSIISANQESHDLKQALLFYRQTTLLREAVNKVTSGETSPSEVIRKIVL
jgi:type IV pilus assembly protein PilB